MWSPSRQVNSCQAATVGSISRRPTISTAGLIHLRGSRGRSSNSSLIQRADLALVLPPKKGQNSPVTDLARVLAHDVLVGILPVDPLVCIDILRAIRRRGVVEQVVRGRVLSHILARPQPSLDLRTRHEPLPAAGA